MTDDRQAMTPGAAVTVAVLLLASLTVMANATISPALPGLRDHYAGSSGIDTLAGLIVTLPSLAVMLAAGPIGWMTDRFDRQKMLLAAGLLYAIGGTSGLWVDSLPLLLIGRAVLGIGVAGTMVLAMAWAADLWQGEARARFLGHQGAATSAGGIIVILLGGALASLHWRGAFAAYLLVVPVTVLALFALAPYAKALRAEKPVASRVNSAQSAFPWRDFALVGGLSFSLMAAFYIIPTRLPFLLGTVGVDNPLLLSLIISLVTAAALPGAILYGRLNRQMSSNAIFALSWLLIGLGMLLLAIAPTAGLMACGVVVVGLGLGPAMPAYTARLMASVSPNSRGRASGLLTTLLFAGQFASPLLSAPLVETLGLAGAFRFIGFIAVGLAAVLASAAILNHRVSGQRIAGSDSCV